MWWPAFGGLAVGIGGLIFPQALGIGFDTIPPMLQADVPRTTIAGILLVKSIIWVIALGSGTSGGVLAPLLMMGAALGGVEGMFLPWEGAGFWPLVSMGAILGGTMRSPLTGIVIALELTHDINMVLPLMVASFLAHGTTVLALSDPSSLRKLRGEASTSAVNIPWIRLEILMAKEAMRTSVIAFSSDHSLDDARHLMNDSNGPEAGSFTRLSTIRKRLAGVLTARR